MRTVHSMQWYACRERPGNVYNYEEDTVRNDDENNRFKKAHERPEGLFSPTGPRVTAYSRGHCDNGDFTEHYVTVKATI